MLRSLNDIALDSLPLVDLWLESASLLRVDPLQQLLSVCLGLLPQLVQPLTSVLIIVSFIVLMGQEGHLGLVVLNLLQLGFLQHLEVSESQLSLVLLIIKSFEGLFSFFLAEQAVLALRDSFWLESVLPLDPLILCRYELDPLPLQLIPLLIESRVHILAVVPFHLRISLRSKGAVLNLLLLALQL